MMYQALIAAVLFFALVPRKTFSIGGKMSLFVHTAVFGVVMYLVLMYSSPPVESESARKRKVMEEAAKIKTGEFVDYGVDMVKDVPNDISSWFSRIFVGPNKKDQTEGEVVQEIAMTS